MNHQFQTSVQNLKTHWQSHRVFWIAFLLAAILFFTNIGADNKFRRAEAYFALGAQMLVEQNEYLLPHSPQELPLNKPPLQYWLIGICYKIFGVDYGAGRIPSAICALGVIALLYFFGARFFGKTAALTAIAFLATNYMFLGFARMAMPDILLTLCVSITICCWILILTGQTNYPRILAAIGYSAIAFGFLAKGPVAIVLAVSPIFLELLISRDFEGVKKLKPFTGLIVFLIITAPYFLLVYLRDGIEPLRTFFIEENLRRFSGTNEYRSRTSRLEYPFTAFLGGFAPWSLLTLIVALKDFKHRKEIDENRRVLRVLYIWMIFPTIFFTISSFKLDYYLLPAMPAMALITARIVSQNHLLTIWPKRFLFILVFILAVILLTIAGFISFGSFELIFPGVRFQFLPFGATVMTLIPVFWYLWRGKAKYLLLSLTLAMWAIIISVYLTFLPGVSKYQSISPLAEKVPDGANVFIYARADEWTQDSLFHLPASQPVKVLTGEADNIQLKNLLQNNPRAVVITYEDDYLKLRESDIKLKVLAETEVYKGGRITPKLLFSPKLDKLMLVEIQNE